MQRTWSYRGCGRRRRSVDAHLAFNGGQAGLDLVQNGGEGGKVVLSWHGRLLCSWHTGRGEAEDTSFFVSEKEMKKIRKLGSGCTFPPQQNRQSQTADRCCCCCCCCMLIMPYGILARPSTTLALVASTWYGIPASVSGQHPAFRRQLTVNHGDACSPSSGQARHRPAFCHGRSEGHIPNGGGT